MMCCYLNVQFQGQRFNIVSVRLIRVVVGCALSVLRACWLRMQVCLTCTLLIWSLGRRVILMGSSWVANDIDLSFKIRPRPYPSFDILYGSCVVYTRPARTNIIGFPLSFRTQRRRDSVARIVTILLADWSGVKLPVGGKGLVQSVMTRSGAHSLSY